MLWRERINSARISMCERCIWSGRLPAEDRAQLAKELSSLIGISSHVLLHNDLRVTMADFLRWFHEEHGMTISPYDTRFAGRHTPGLQIHDPVGDDEMMSRCMQGFFGRISGNSPGCAGY